METNTKIGLVLGKFAPLHRGHQYLIETALSQVDRLYVLVYDAKETTHVPLTKRSNWVRALYPNKVTVLEGHNGPTAEGDSAEVMKLQEEYIKSMLPERVTHFFSSEWYGEHVSRALGAKNVQVDPARTTYPVSATKVRADRSFAKTWLHPLVYRDNILKVALHGAESTGKSTLTRYLANRYGTVYMPEYGREYWDRHHNAIGKLSSEQMVDLALGHIEREEKLIAEANGVIFVDTTALTTRQFCQFYQEPIHPKLEQLANACKSRYDVFVLCGTDIPYVEDGTRNGEQNRRLFQQSIEKDLQTRSIDYTLVQGNLPLRAAKVERSLPATCGLRTILPQIWKPEPVLLRV